MQFPDKNQQTAPLDIREYLFKFTKHKWLIMFCFVVSVSATALWFFKQPKIWRAKSKIQFSSGMRLPVPNVYTETAGSYIRGQSEIINSKTFKKRLEKKALEAGWDKHLSPEDLAPKVSFRQLSGLDIIAIDIDSISREYALFYNNLLINEYIKFKVEKKGTSAEIALLELTSQINAAEKQIGFLEEQILAFEKSHDLIAHDLIGNIPANTVGTLQSSLAALSNEREIIEAQMEKFNKKIDPFSIESSLARIYSFPLINGQKENVAQAETIPAYFLRGNKLQGYSYLSAQKVELKSNLINESLIYKKSHPKIIKLMKELDNIQKHIDSEIDCLQKKLNSQYNMLKIEEETKKRLLKKWRNKIIVLNKQSREYGNLKTALGRRRQFYNLLFQRVNEIDIATNFNNERVQIQVIENPYLLPKPVAPKPFKGMMTAIFLGLGLGLGLAFTVEYLNDTIRSKEEFVKLFSAPMFSSLPMLALIPAFASYHDKKTDEKIIKPDDKQNVILEIFRQLRTDIVLSSPPKKLTTLLITSAVPREGKTQTAVNLACCFAISGTKTLLIDGDLRKGKIHSYFNLKKDPGCSVYLIGQDTLEAVIQPSGIENLDILPCGIYPPNPPELLAGESMKDLLSKVSGLYERVIIDSPPLINVTDSTILGSLTQGTLFIVEGGKTRRALIKQSVENLINNHVNIIGVIINNLERKKHDYYSQYYSHYKYYNYGYEEQEEQE